MLRLLVTSFVLVLSLFNPVGFAQSIEEVHQNSTATNFIELKAEIDAFLEQNPRAPGYKQWERKAWFLEPRLYPSGQPRDLTMAAWKAYRGIALQQADQRATHGAWSFKGPLAGGPGLGRLNCIEIHPTNDNIIYVGASNGGIWKTTNGGSSWSNISPHIPLLAIADIEIDPTNPNIVYALTGDGDPFPLEPGTHGQGQVSTIGILKSSNAGSTWYPTGFTQERPNNFVPVKLLMHPSDPDIQFLAARNGLFKTTDAWDTNSEVIQSTIFDVEFKPGDPMIMYAAGDDDIHRSTDLGETWTQLSDADFSVMAGATRIELAVSPEDPTGVYALAGDWEGLIALYRSTSNGINNSWQLMNSTSTTLGEFTTYCVALAADPDDFDDLYGGMQWVSKSLTGGSSWSNIVQSTVHADLHDIVMRNGDIYVACDGGIYKSTDYGSSWTDLSDGLAITEIYRIAGTPQNDNLYYCGAQDNGTYKTTGSTTFTGVLGSDGMVPMINYDNSNIVYASIQLGSFRKSTNGGSTFSSISVPGGDGAWISPSIMDPSDPDIVFFGKTSVYRSDDAGGTYVNLGSPSGDVVNVLAQATNDRSWLYVSDGGQIFRTTDALSTSGSVSWTTITNNLPNLFITGIVVHPTNKWRVWVTLSGYDEGDKVYHSGDGGNTWINESGSLPNVPANCIAIHNGSAGIDALYIGTDIGVFYRDDNLGDWIYYSHSMPAVTVNDLYINEADNKIAAGTYGRGLWTSSLYTGCPGSIVLNDPGSAIGGIRYHSASTQISSYVEYRRDLGTEVYYTAGQRVLLNPGFAAGGLIRMHAKTGGCPSIAVPFAPQNPQGGPIVQIH